MEIITQSGQTIHPLTHLETSSAAKKIPAIKTSVVNIFYLPLTFCPDPCLLPVNNNKINFIYQPHSCLRACKNSVNFCI